MPDLSNLLGDVYGDDPDGEPVRHEPPAGERAEHDPPAWADESVLDAAFANWTPGPPPDAPAAEREVIGASGPSSVPPLPDDLAAALSAALVGAPPGEVAMAPAPPPQDSPAPAPDPTGTATDIENAPLPKTEAPSWSELAAARRALTERDDPFVGAAPVTGPLRWQRGDDDILPRRTASSRRGRSLGGLNLRRR
jgi:hypothetical protein